MASGGGWGGWGWGGVERFGGQWQGGWRAAPGWGEYVSAVVAVVIGPTGRRGGVGLVVVFAERCGVVGGGVDISLLEGSGIEIGAFIWQQVVLVERLELHGRVLLILWRGVALVVEVVGGGGVNDGGLLRRLVEALTVHIDQEGQQARPEETRDASGDQVDGGECSTVLVLIKARCRENDRYFIAVSALSAVPHTGGVALSAAHPTPHL